MPVLFRDDAFLKHETGAHPESPERLRSVYARLDRAGLLAGWDVRSPGPVAPDVLDGVHSSDHISRVRRVAEAGGGRIESDTVVCADSYEVALCAVGAAVEGVDCVLAGDARVAVGLIRPPGHHALADAAMGFCLFNNVAVAARYAVDRYRLSRVLVVDWDVHHGNGTQDLFYESPDVWFFSAHRSPFYPGTGASDETGTGAGTGTTFNLPLPEGIPRAEYRARFHSLLVDAATRCRPELLLLSAGFDAHAADPIGSLGLESEDFATLTHLVGQVADQYCDGRIVSVLEGGYNVDALAESVACHLSALGPGSTAVRAET
ncbi:MAG: histone deacetylase [Planctomycetaceae bacterium]